MHIEASRYALSGRHLICSFVLFVVRAFIIQYVLYFIFYFISYLRTAWEGGGVLPDFLFLFSFPCSAGFERHWPPFRCCCCCCCLTKKMLFKEKIVSHIQRIGCQPEKKYFTRWPIPLVVCWTRKYKKYKKSGSAQYSSYLGLATNTLNVINNNLYQLSELLFKENSECT